MDQSTTPLVDALGRCANRENAAFYTPGHKRGQGITQKHRALFGSAAFRADLPELPDLDNLFAPKGVTYQAQQLAAEAFGAQRTRFLANGSTCGVEAAILATCNPGDKLILPRNIHTSVISGLILSGAVPVYISSPYSPKWNIPVGITDTQAITAALYEHPDAKAVLIVSPTYEGICSNLSAIAQVTHDRNIPLIVDEAHGPHFIFHPQLPTSALEAGADIAIQSAHKVLSAFTQAAMLHTQGDRIDQNRLARSLQLTQSTSPSFLLLGSLDAARHQMATQGQALLTHTIELAYRAQNALKALPGISVLGPKGDRYVSSSLSDVDCTRLTVNVSGLGLTGFEADEILHTQYAVTAELPTLSNLTFILSIGNTSIDIDRLIHGFQGLCTSHSTKSQKLRGKFPTPATYVSTDLPVEPVFSLISPRQAFFAIKTRLPIEQAVGKICAETLCPYPPGIPILFPGEPITESAIAHLQATLAAGGIITGCDDPTLQTILTL